MRRPSILFINRVYPPVRGATGRVLQELAQAFAQEGWHVTVITTGRSARRELDGAVRVIRVKGPEKPGGALSYFRIWIKMLYVALRLKRRHLLVTMSDPPLIVVAGQIISRIKKSRHINWCQDLYPDILPALGYHLPGFLMNFFHKISRNAMKGCEKVIVPGRCMARHLNMEEMKQNLVVMVPNWPDRPLVEGPPPEKKRTKPFHPPQVNGARPYEALLKEGQRFRVLYAGNIGLAHPADMILDAAEILQRDCPDVEIVFVGDGKRFDSLAQERQRRGLENIRFLPWQPTECLQDLMESGDVHLISMTEAAAGLMVPSKLYAALAVARPCILIGPEQSETAKVIHDFRTGKIVPQNQPQALAEAIKFYRLSGEGWFSAHGGAAQAREVFTPASSIEAWMERAWDAVQDELRERA